MDQNNPNKIDANPTKEFFISMLTRDLELNAAIMDLVDNCIDGALRLKKDKLFSGLRVDIKGTKDKFSISDNCGGIPVEIARNYAFRFGRSLKATPTPYGLSSFGVGMKRSLFKMGNHFRIESSTLDSRFVLDVDVVEWSKIPDWVFDFTEVQEGIVVPPDQIGTTIVVDKLFDGVVRDLESQGFWDRLSDSIATKLESSIEHGLTISIQGKEVKARKVIVRFSEVLPVVMWETEIDTVTPPVKVRIYAGVGDSDPFEAGWYVYCNDRIILQADRTEVTGWGDASDTGIPKFHGQFARFRGSVYFDCEDARKLPWNTTKTGLSRDNPIYLAVRLKMIDLMRQVINFLNDLDKEKDQEEQLRLELVEQAQTVELSKTKTSQRFDVKVQSIKGPKMVNIQFRKEQEKLDFLMNALGKNSAKAIGEECFDIVYRVEKAE